MPVISIIGTAGRKEDQDKMTKSLYMRMYSEALTRIEGYCKERAVSIDLVSLVSGGAAWADHLAVSLFLRGNVKFLTLHLPSEFYDNQFQPTPGADGAPGVANYYHQLFGEKMGGSTLKGLQTAFDKGAVKVVTPGFKNRNRMVAKCDYLIALTWGPFGGNYTQEDSGWRNSTNAGLKDGGTAHTWNESRAPHKTHISLSEI
jgi:hypothetical protein